MNDVKVSIIVPIYNVEKYLPRCIDSLLDQTFDDYEIILVNDGSPDRCDEIIESYATQYPSKIVALTKENGGLSDARNYGIPYAKGEFIGFIDSDDYVDATFIEKMYNKVIQAKADIVVCGYYGVDEIQGKSKWLQKGNTDLYNYSVKDLPDMILMNAPYAWNKMYRKSLFIDQNIEFPKGLLWEDIPTIYPLLVSAKKIAKVDQPLIYYVLKREGSITGTYSRKMLQLFDSLELLIERFKRIDKFEEFYDQLLVLNMRHIMYRFKEFIKYRDSKMKHEFVDRGFAHLDKYFPGWKENNRYFEFHDKANLKYKEKYVSKQYWKTYVLTPNFLHHLKIGYKTSMKKTKMMFSKNNRVKYQYMHYFKKGKIQENAILFESFHGTTISDSPFYMMRELLENRKDQNFKIYFTSQTPDIHQEMLKEYGYDVELVSLNTKKYAKALATSKYLVNNVSFPPYFIRRDEQVYMNTWHGTPLKTLGKRMVQGIEDMSNMQRNFLHATHLLFPNDFTMAHMMEDYNLYELFTGQAILSGYPRNSIFLDQAKALEMRKKFHLEDKEVFAYMPTWRGQKSSDTNVNTYAMDVKNILDRLDESLRDHQVLYVNLHSLVKKDVVIDQYKHIFPFPNVDNYEFLNCCDVLISDFSSVFFDFSITQKPIVLFMYDYDEYMTDRGTYFDVKTLPFEKIYNIDDLIAFMQLKDKTYKDQNSLIDYHNQFTRLDSIDSTKYLNDYFFFNQNADQLEIIDYSYNKDVEHTVFIPSKVYKRRHYKRLEAVKTMDNPLVVFRRNEFNYLLREYLLNELNDKVSYVVIKESTAYTLSERIAYILHKFFKICNVDLLNVRLFDNILPNIKIKEIICKSKVNKIQRAAVSFENLNKKA